MEEQTRQQKRQIWAWASFDFANSPFTTLVVTFIYGTYFTQALSPDPITGTQWWSHGVTASAILIALLSPFLGALADRGGYRRRFLAISVTTCVVGCVGLYFIAPGSVTSALTALGVFVLANVAFEVGMVFYNAFLPDIAPPSKIGWISGFGWGLGYFGGLAALVVALVTLVQPEVPWFGFTTENGENIRATNLLVALWFGLFSLPMLTMVKEDKSQVSRDGKILGAAARQLVETFREVKRYRQVVRFLLARLIYNDALVTIFAFGGIFAAGVFGFGFQEILVFGIVLNITAGSGAILMGWLDDRIGGKRTIFISVIGLMSAMILAVFAPTREWFWASGVLVGIFSGPNQSASRSLMARFVPPEKENEFFGFFAFSGKATAFVGPMVLGFVTKIFDSQRAGLAVTIALFAISLLVLRTVDEEEGIAAANESHE